MGAGGWGLGLGTWGTRDERDAAAARPPTPNAGGEPVTTHTRSGGRVLVSRLSAHNRSPRVGGWGAAVALLLLFAVPAHAAGPAVYVPKGASALERLAAQEVRRYVYLTTRKLLPIVTVGAKAPGGSGILVARKDRAAAGALAARAGIGAKVAGLKPQCYVLRSAPGGLVLIAGGDGAGTLYGAYRYAERLGARFYLHGDVIPDKPAKLLLAGIDETGKPLFDTRGIQPFHDFPEGPDWWNTDDYRAIVGQLPKLRMNFLGLHTYPEGIAEPTVWIGQPSDIGDGAKVAFSYPSSYQNSARGDWGYAAKKTSAYLFGAAGLFDQDDAGSDAMRGLTPRPTRPDDCNLLFERTGTMLRDAFTEARALGIQTCVGTETPLTIPALVRDRLKAAGIDPASDAARKLVYEGMFRRISQAYPVDYYWFWTPEGWTWSGTTEQQVAETLTDLKAAIAAAKDAKAPFTLATCGWVLGPPNNRSLFDDMLPKDMPMSCINQQVGYSPVEPGFANVKGRPKWAIPWLEDDPALTAPQLWVGRMRRDAQDALKYGCTGLMGIHWRTRILAPNVSALANAAWEQNWDRKAAPPVLGAVGGNVAAFPPGPVVGADDSTMYRTVRYGMSAYRIPVPNGEYTVTLRFVEPHYDTAGVRVFDVTLQGKKVIEALDILGKVGKNHALDTTYEHVRVTDGLLTIGFPPRVEFPCIAAIEVVGPAKSVRINCGGPAYGAYMADPPATAVKVAALDYYLDWARAEFGPEAAPQIAAIFDQVDGNLPKPLTWTDGPGGLTPDGTPWEKVAPDYAFVDRMAKLEPLVKGAGSKARFAYWLNWFRYLRASAELRCAWAEQDRAIAAAAAGDDRARIAETQALPARRKVVSLLREVYGYLLANVSTNGELGTIMNWEQHSVPNLIERPGAQLAQILGKPLPEDAQPAATYSGPLRVFLPTLRTRVEPGATLTVTAHVLSSTTPRSVQALWRPIGAAQWHSAALGQVARGVYRAELKVDTDIEYYVRAEDAAGHQAVFPDTAPTINQTVVAASLGAGGGAARKP